MILQYGELGTRMWRRGANLDGDTANFIETEQLLEIQVFKFSLLQVIQINYVSTCSLYVTTFLYFAFIVNYILSKYYLLTPNCSIGVSSNFSED